ncbi:MAG: hypothetical protein Salg2KO_14940 [Salibacteraceae bacterium]
MSNPNYNIRVYGILINDHNQLLVSDERYGGMEFTKFPGGGLEPGEGLVDCLKREFSEELSIAIEVVDHFYTTDFFQQSAFDDSQQLISIYYKVSYMNWQNIDTSMKPYDFSDTDAAKAESYRWVSLKNLNEEVFRWPIDKLVCRRLLRSS